MDRSGSLIRIRRGRIGMVMRRPGSERGLVKGLVLLHVDRRSAPQAIDGAGGGCGRGSGIGADRAVHGFGSAVRVVTWAGRGSAGRGGAGTDRETCGEDQ